jgi:predicted Fe-S protein YdhL (DUF1289 family)
MLKRTPCVGTCSTTYGDLVCRGCKRFAHEIVQWNRFEPDQRDAVWSRLLDLRAGAVETVLEIIDVPELRACAHRVGLAGADDLTPPLLVYDLLTRAQWRQSSLSPASFGARPRQAVPDAGPAALLTRIDREIYARSLAHYERNYRIPAE